MRLMCYPASIRVLFCSHGTLLSAGILLKRKVNRLVRQNGANFGRVVHMTPFVHSKSDIVHYTQNFRSSFNNIIFFHCLGSTRPQIFIEIYWHFQQEMLRWRLEL